MSEKIYHGLILQALRLEREAAYIMDEAQGLRRQAKKLGTLFKCDSCDDTVFVEGANAQLPETWQQVSCCNGCCVSYFCEFSTTVQLRCWKAH